MAIHFVAIDKKISWWLLVSSSVEHNFDHLYTVELYVYVSLVN